MDIKQIYINNLKRIRKEKNVTQKELAEQSNINLSYIGQIEIGKRFPSIELIEKFAEILDTPVYCFFMSDEDRTASAYPLVKLQYVAENIADNINTYIKSEIDKLIK